MRFVTLLLVVVLAACDAATAPTATIPTRRTECAFALVFSTAAVDSIRVAKCDDPRLNGWTFSVYSGGAR